MAKVREELQMNKKQEIQDKITENKACRENSKHALSFYKERVDFYDKDLIELEKQLKECDELKLVDGWTKEYSYTLEQRTKDGRCYSTLELLEIATKNTTTRDRLEAYSRVIDADWRENWNSAVNQRNYYINCDQEDGEFIVKFDTRFKRLGTTYMSKKAAIRIVDALNNNEIEL